MKLDESGVWSHHKRLMRRKTVRNALVLAGWMMVWTGYGLCGPEGGEAGGRSGVVSEMIVPVVIFGILILIFMYALWKWLPMSGDLDKREDGESEDSPKSPKE